jgi:glycosyltransferase involved in cell wall biosynthesis
MSAASADPAVTVVMIFYQAEAFLAAAIDSVLGQTFPDLELLLVDDGSTDGGPAIARHYASADPVRVRVLRHPGGGNRGMSAARNRGIAEARGRYVSFVDADDALFPSAIEEQLAILESWPGADLVFGPIEMWHSWTDDPADANRDVVSGGWDSLDTVVEPPALLVRMLELKTAIPTGFLIRRAALKRVGGFEESFPGLNEDQAFMAKLLLDSAGYVSSQCWYRYRQHPGSCVQIALRAGRRHAARARFLAWLARHLRDHGVSDRRVWRVVRAETWKCRKVRLRGALGRLRQRGMAPVAGLASRVAGVVRGGLDGK